MDTFIRTGSSKRSVGFIIPADPSRCWLWQGSCDSNGYGQAYSPTLGRLDKAHRVIWALLHGYPPPRSSGMELDHTCRTRRCVNPDHMELVTVAENRRRRNMTILRRPITHGTISGYGYRSCRCDLCRSAWTAYLRERRYQKRAAEALAAIVAR